MNTTTHEKIEQYARNQLAQADSRLYAYTVDLNTNQPYPQRELFSIIKQYLFDYQQNGSEPRLIAIAGFRGVGKTTLVAQLFRALQCEQYYKLYISIDELIKSLGVGLHDVLSVYAEVLGTVFEKLEKPVYLFLDEVHYEEKWAAVLKSIYDRSKKVFVIATGSAALLLQSDKTNGCKGKELI